MRPAPALLLLAACGIDTPADPDTDEVPPVAPATFDPIDDVDPYAGLWLEETLPASEILAVDVLLVVDDSCSMVEEQRALGEAFGAVLEPLLGSGVDWHLGLVSTDTENPDRNGRLVGTGGYHYVGADTPDPVEVFREVIGRLGTGGSSTERGLLAAYRALAQPTDKIRQWNHGFYREDAALLLLFVSDEEDQSAPEVRENEFLTYLEDLKPDPALRPEASALVGPVPTGCSGPGGDATPGTIYLDLVEATAGASLSLCEADWRPFLHQLGERAAAGSDTVTLSLPPVPESVLVRVDLDTRDRPHRTWLGVRTADLLPDETVADACARAGLVDCFGYDVDPALPGLRFTDGWRPPAAASVHVRYRSE